MAAPRLHLELPLAAGARVVLPPAPSRHVQVLRLQPGDAIVLFTGSEGVEWPAEIIRIGRTEVEVCIGAPRPVERELGFAVTLAVGMPANERMDGLIEKATELGVAAIQPLVCARSVVRLAGERALARQRHWRAVAAAASEQCGRVRVPAIAAPARLDAWLGALADAPARRVLLSVDRGAAPPRRGPGADLLVLSGPEGGLAPDEEVAAIGRGFVPLSLGPRVLRADTAPLALLAWLAIAAIGEPT